MAINSFSNGNFINSLLAAGKNAIINGGMDIWQRGTSIAYAGGNQYTADRWCFGSGSVGKTISRQVTGDTTNLPFLQYCMRVQRDSGVTSTLQIKMNQSFETVNSIRFAGQIVTVSYYARAGANYSSASNLLTLDLKSGTGTDQNVDATYTGAATVATSSATLTTTWQRFTATGTVSASATEIALIFNYTPTGTAGAADYFEVTGVQLELGTTATTFSRAGGTIQGELAACQRYYFRQTGVAAGSAFAPLGIADSTTTANPAVFAPVYMRAQPSAIDFSLLRFSDGYTGVVNITSLAAANYTTNAFVITATVASGLTLGRAYILQAQGASSYIGFSAEL
jgi:hypothetical protein